jgi:hypothetical protein
MLPTLDLPFTLRFGKKLLCKKDRVFHSITEVSLIGQFFRKTFVIILYWFKKKTGITSIPLLIVELIYANICSYRNVDEIYLLKKHKPTEIKYVPKNNKRRKLFN